MSIGILDLSSMFHRLWHIDRLNVEHNIITFLKKIKESEVIVAVDSPPYKRKEWYPEYKSKRDIPDPELIGCLKNIKNSIYNEGFKIAKSEGWEADDVIGTLVLEHKGEDITVYGSDKDLLQATPLTDVFTLETIDARSKLGVEEFQVPDYLALVGDTSDNIPGARGIGEKTAVSLLETFGQIDGIYKAIKETPEMFTKPAVLKSLQENETQVRDSLKLTLLNCKVDIEYVQKENVSDLSVHEGAEDMEDQKTIAVRQEIVDYKKSLEPIDFNQAKALSCIFAKSALYPHFKSPEQVMVVIMRGRELGFGASSALSLINMIQGKPAIAAAGMLALVMSRKDVCEYIYCKEMTEKTCTCVTKRIGYPEHVSRTFTIEMAQKLGLTNRDNWRKQPEVMLQWRCFSQLIRQVYPDVINGLHSIEELE